MTNANHSSFRGVSETTCEANIRALTQLNEPIVLIQADQTGLPRMHEAIGFQGLVQKLYLASNAKVALTRNIAPRVGLVAGTIGIVQDVFYGSDKSHQICRPMFGLTLD
jgi:hypothetical protein